MILKWFIRTILTLLALCVGFCIIVVIINLHDEPPSEDALYIEELFQKLPDVADENNAYFYLLGFDANVGVDPFDLGLKIHSLTTVDSDVKYDMELPANAAKEYSKELNAIMIDCVRPYLDCSAKLKKYEDWSPYLAKFDWFVSRYKKLLSFREFRNVNPVDLIFPTPSYATVFEGQRLFFISLLNAASVGNVTAVRESLSDDLAFWRMMLASSDILIEKMIATAAIRNHFFLGNIVLSRLPPESQLSAVPDTWTSPLSKDEYAFDRTLIGEHIFVRNSLRLSDSNEFPNLEELFQLTEAWQLFLIERVFKRQATNNLFATLLRSRIERSHVSDIKMFSQDAGLPNDVDLGIYNFVGRVFAQAAGVSYDDYYRRVADIEGFRRSSLAIAHIRAKQLPLAAWADFLQKSEYRDPYTEQAFGIDAERKALIFVGLGKEPNKIFYAEL